MAKNYNRRTEKDYGLRRKLFYKSFVYLVVKPVAKLMYNLAPPLASSKQFSQGHWEFEHMNF